MSIFVITFTGRYHPHVTSGVLLLFGILVPTCLAILSRRRHRYDVAPDYLGRCIGHIFERDGLCFTISIESDGQTATFTVMYQNRYEGRAVAQVALRPVGSTVATVSSLFECGPAGFGVVKFPVAIPARHQGKWVTMEIGASTDYPLGKGEEVRFRAGRSVQNDSEFRYRPLNIRALPGSSLPGILIQTATTIRIALPSNVAEYVPDEETGHAEELWSLSKNGQTRLAVQQ
jgi:hypothetical protein